MKKLTGTNLMEITKYESGVVIYKESEEGFITNWSCISGIPKFLEWIQIGMGEEIELEEIEEIDSWACDLALELGQEECNKVLEEGGILCNDELKIDKMYENDEVIIVTFEGWN